MNERNLTSIDFSYLCGSACVPVWRYGGRERRGGGASRFWARHVMMYAAAAAGPPILYSGVERPPKQHITKTHNRKRRKHIFPHL